MTKKCEDNKLLLTLALMLTGVISLCQSLPAEGLSDERVIIQHYTAADRIPNAITDLSFDNTGNIWLTTENDNVRVFDGTHVRMLETPDVKGAPQFSFSRVMRD